MGQSSKSVLPKIWLPCARKTVQWDVRLNGAVSHWPGGKSSVPPPAAATAATARRTAIVSFVWPSPTAPKSFTEKIASRPVRTRSSLLSSASAAANNTRSHAVRFIVHNVFNPRSAFTPRTCPQEGGSPDRIWVEGVGAPTEFQVRTPQAGDFCFFFI